MLYEIRMLVLLSCGFLFMLEYSEISPDILQPSETFPWKMKTSTCVCKKRSYKMYSQMAGDFHVLPVLETNVHVLELKISDSNSPAQYKQKRSAVASFAVFAVPSDTQLLPSYTSLLYVTFKVYSPVALIAIDTEYGDCSVPVTFPI